MKSTFRWFYGVGNETLKKNNNNELTTSLRPGRRKRGRRRGNAFRNGGGTRPCHDDSDRNFRGFPGRTRGLVVRRFGVEEGIGRRCTTRADITSPPSTVSGRLADDRRLCSVHGGRTVFVAFNRKATNVCIRTLCFQWPDQSVPPNPT